MALAALVVLAMAGPFFSPSGVVAAKGGPLLLLIDDFWTAAPDWSLRMKAAESRLAEAGRLGQPAAVTGHDLRRAGRCGRLHRHGDASARADPASFYRRPASGAQTRRKPSCKTIPARR